jgi:hypothetical protein
MNIYVHSARGHDDAARIGAPLGGDPRADGTWAPIVVGERPNQRSCSAKCRVAPSRQRQAEALKSRDRRVCELLTRAMELLKS